MKPRTIESFIILIALVITFTVGFDTGEKSAMQSLEREVIELNIELTKLEIKKLTKARGE